MDHNKQIAEEIYQQGYCLIDNFLEEKHYQGLRAAAECMHEEGQFKSAKIGHHLGTVQNNGIRNDTISWLDKHSDNLSIQAYFTKISSLAKLLNQSLFLGLIDFETHFAIYQPGAFYKKHIDQFANAKERRISCVYYLNEHWEERDAGQLKLYDENARLITSILPLANRFICFESSLPHEVCETRRTRYSIAGWMKTRSLTNQDQ